MHTLLYLATLTLCRHQPHRKYSMGRIVERVLGTSGSSPQCAIGVLALQERVFLFSKNVDLGMREECKYFLRGSCRFGKKCKYLHVRRTALIDPPAWIHSCFPEVDTYEISPDEARLRFLASPSTFQREWDDLFIHNYFALCKKLDTLLQDSKVGSFTERCVDIRDRRNLSRLVPVFDHRRLSEEIDVRNIEKRQQTAGQRRSAVDHRQPADYYASSRQDYVQNRVASDSVRDRDDMPHSRDTQIRDYGDPGGRMQRDTDRREYSQRSGYYRDNVQTKDVVYRPHRDRQDGRGAQTYGRPRSRNTDDREDTMHFSRGGPGTRDRYRNQYRSMPSAERSKPRRDSYGYDERDRSSVGRMSNRGWMDDSNGRQHNRHNEDTTVDLLQDDVVIDEFLPNDDTEEFEL